MTRHAFPTQAEIDAALSVLRMAGYRISPPKRSAADDAIAAAELAAPRFGPTPKYRSTMRNWDRAYCLFTFTDGAVVGAYVSRESEGRGWYVGAAARAASAKYRDRRTPNILDPDAEMRFNRTIAVPEIAAIDCDDAPIDVDLAALNDATAKYRVANRDLRTCLG